jgi:hypothetical protein
MPFSLRENGSSTLSSVYAITENALASMILIAVFSLPLRDE